MSDWDFSPPPPSTLGDHDVLLEGSHLKGKRIALLLTGSIAAMKAPEVARSLRRQGAKVVAFASKEALRYTTIDTLEWCTTNKVVTQLTAAAEHLSDDAPFDVYLVAPATYNTINKMRYGIADGVITSSLASAIGRMEQEKTKILVVPTMHGSLHNSILTESLQKLKTMGIGIISPRSDYGKHNLPASTTIVAQVCRAVSRSLLKGVSVLVTGGPTPVEIDNVRRITNRFTGRLGINIAEELYLRGAEVKLIHGESTFMPPAHLPHQIAKTFDEYLDLVLGELDSKSYTCGVFSAAVADYKPETIIPGKVPSGGALKTINLLPTLKVIDEVKAKFPELYMVIFKYQEGISHEQLMEIALNRLQRGYPAVIANRGEETGVNGEQVAYLVTQIEGAKKIVGKKEIAYEIVEHLERVC
ncbi:MAG: bifunctional phosphopantothenoylcysteine decarboxylase/phosphopantothenate--cysteine ligase CoaBC [Symploca sp. SIO3C6]|uniref:Coenzyme A biosynthesis bifunctional protein CoaBC n=1 Tax=Symploca sp. SIO1C4 TaxID=2607765 RepID=A0A6B3N8Z8_9CYAN|nr:bifunctional phosphopantothenoylcysteine decarboxylase/phosphopantothenate--cysteine ligase CoaBC [Symploca sp. SIO3C6]NER27345.1 bifunctional phosphopantothenoylcysteine decarboxylase/phosphopantothenate--cysteine ligase CoaBC [Symploca sp. SIO1C4]